MYAKNNLQTPSLLLETSSEYKSLLSSKTPLTKYFTYINTDPYSPLQVTPPHPYTGTPTQLHIAP